ncbi:hypothetical protein [Streptomyces sp. SCL15-6]|uniref:hypothetical protein n=1 Tax=Streptomyces sp. SCL15-6 TaxID=2967222 RepID=UPI002965FB6A|nr:hypothetical protein [Streptomyces sp. SCL15-6]
MGGLVTLRSTAIRWPVSSQATTHPGDSHGSMSSGSAGIFIQVRGTVTEAATLRTIDSCVTGRT